MGDQSRQTNAVETDSVLIGSSCSRQNFFFIRMHITECFSETAPDVLIDLTTPEIGKLHTKIALEHGVRPVVGTTGFSESDLNELMELTDEKGIGAIIAPNFALGAVLMRFLYVACRFPALSNQSEHPETFLKSIR